MARPRRIGERIGDASGRLSLQIVLCSRPIDIDRPRRGRKSCLRIERCSLYSGQVVVA